MEAQRSTHNSHNPVVLSQESEHIPGKLREEEVIDFKKRQRRRSSLTPLTVAGLPKPALSTGRRSSTVSTESWCEYLYRPYLMAYIWEWC